MSFEDLLSLAEADTDSFLKVPRADCSTLQEVWKYSNRSCTTSVALY